MDEPLVSVGVVIAGPIPGTERAIRSLLADGYDNLEIVLSDATASAESVLFAQSLAEREPRVQLHHHHRRHRSVIEHLQAVRDAAHGEYFLWLDGRGYVEPGYLAGAVAFLGANPSHALVHGTTVGKRVDGSPFIQPPVASAFESPARRVEAMLAQMPDGSAWHGVYRRAAIMDVPIHAALGFEFGCLASVAWRGKIGALPEIRFVRDIAAGDATAGDMWGSEETARLGLASFQATDPWLTVAALLFSNIAFFDDAFRALPFAERLQLAVAAAETIGRRWKVLDEGMMVSFATRLFPAGNVLDRFRSLRASLVETVMALGAVPSTDPFIQDLVSIINVLCRMRIGSIPMSDEDQDIVRRLEQIWDSDRSTNAQNKVALVSALYL